MKSHDHSQVEVEPLVGDLEDSEWHLVLEEAAWEKVECDGYISGV